MSEKDLSVKAKELINEALMVQSPEHITSEKLRALKQGNMLYVPKDPIVADNITVSRIIIRKDVLEKMSPNLSYFMYHILDTLRQDARLKPLEKIDTTKGFVVSTMWRGTPVTLELTHYGKQDYVLTRAI